MRHSVLKALLVVLGTLPPVFVTALARADGAQPLPPLPTAATPAAPALPAPPASPQVAAPSEEGSATTEATATPAAGPPPTAPRNVRDADTTLTFTLCNGTDTKSTVHLSTGCSGVFGLRGSVTRVDGVPATEGAGLMFSADGEDYWQRRIFNTRDEYRVALGGGAVGLEGALLGAFAFGFRAPVTEQQGPVVRAGAYGYLLGNDAFTSSLIELPQLQVGWQWSRGHAVVELAGTTGVALTGRYRVGDAEARDIGQGFTVGAHASFQIPWLRVSLEAERLPTHDAIALPVDVATGTLCAVASPLAICADARITQARAFVAGAEPLVRVGYAGLTIGLTGEQ